MNNPVSPRIYLDHNATTPISDRVREQVPAWLDAWGNASSIHHESRGPKLLMRESRDKIAKAIGATPLELIFTSGGSEANNLAIKGIFENQALPNLFGRAKRNRYIIGAVEHPSVKRAAEAIIARGAHVDWLPVSREGKVDLEEYRRLLSIDTALVSFMLANNETGNLFPIREMAEMAHAVGALFHSDCVQAFGKIPVDLREIGVDLATFSGHKFYALKGSGFLFARRGVGLESLIHGGGQERHRRGGTENVLAIASLGLQCERSAEIAPKAVELARLRDHFESEIMKRIPLVHLTGAESPRLPNTSSLVIPGIDGETLLMNLDMRGFAVSTGAACSSGSPEPSPVLLAMGLTRAEAQASLRVALGWGTTAEQIDLFIQALVEVVCHLRSINGFEVPSKKHPKECSHVCS